EVYGIANSSHVTPLRLLYTLCSKKEFEKHAIKALSHQLSFLQKSCEDFIVTVSEIMELREYIGSFLLSSCYKQNGSFYRNFFNLLRSVTLVNSKKPIPQVLTSTITKDRKL
ncbi:MAG TPA: hypothetical protein VHA52_08220, partial [Candidatus Babeliaceae bacterium]|nr:hypothetical protein [Candidatus Babeliaceae bacterium]